NEAISVLSNPKEKVRVLAGGTDLFVHMKKGLDQPSLLLDIKSISELNHISISQNRELILGAGVTLAALEQWARMEKNWTGLSLAAASIGSEQVRNRATVVGNVCRASPAGDMIPMLIVLDAKVEIHGPEGKRSVLVENVLTGPGQTALTKGEMVVSLKIPEPQFTGTAYLKHSIRRAMEIAVVAVAARITLDNSSQKIGCARIVLGAVAPTPIRIPEAEIILIEKGVNAEVLEKISELATNRAKPISDLRGTKNYRSEMVGVLIKRAVKQAWKNVMKRESVL
ncbi:hypothetical protein LCGC14_2779350, partial [marine sediment metagenome]